MKRKLLKVFGFVAVLALLVTFLSPINVTVNETNTEYTITVGTVASAAGVADYTVTGVNDDAIIETALAALPANGGSLVLLSGEYHFNSKCLVDENNILINGVGSSVIIYLDDNSDSYMFDITGDNVTIKNIQINGNKDNQTLEQAGVHVAGNIFHLEDCYIHDVYGDGCELSNPGEYGWVKNCYFEDNYEQDIHVNGMDITFIENNVCLNNSAESISIASANTINSTTIRGNYVSGATRGIRVGGGITLAGNIANVIIESNQLIANDINIAVTHTGLLENISIADNIIKDANLSDGIEITTETVGLSIDHNIISGNPTYGIDIQADNVSITNNTIIKNGDRGIDLNGDYCSVKNNRIELNQQEGVHAHHCDYCDISFNELFSNGQAGTNTYNAIEFYLGGADTLEYTKCNYNTIVSQTAIVHKYGIYSNNGGTQQYNQFVGNTIVGYGTGSAFIPLNTTSQIRYNQNYVTENSGMATIVSGTTFIKVAHGLSITPDENKFDVTALEIPTNAPVMVSVANNATSTYFWIVADADPGASNLDVGWNYRN